MQNLIRTNLLLLLLGLFFFNSCKKSSREKQQTSSPGYHIDNVLTGNFGTNRTLLLTPADNNTLIDVSIDNQPFNSVDHAFKLMYIDKNKGLKSVVNYLIDPKYNLQSGTCSDVDQDGNIWVGGTLQKNDTAYSKPFLVKLDKGGNVLQAQYFPVYHGIYYQDNYAPYSLKVLKNGDLFWVLSMGYDMILMRLKTTGEVVWMNRYLSPDRVFFDYQGQIIEDSSGNLAFLGNGQNGTYLFKTDATGNFIFQKRIPAFGSSGKLYALSTGEYIITGENETGGPQQTPYVIKVDPANGGILQAKIMTGITNNTVNDTFNDIQEVNGQLRFVHASDFQYNTVSMDMNLNVLKIQRTLTVGGHGFGYTFKLYFDVPNNAIYHLLDISGPNKGGGFQFIKTNLDGQSCHNDPGDAVKIPLVDESLTVSDAGFTLSQLDMVPKAINFSLTKTSVASFTTADGCTE